jgi:hypothetical protein
MVKKRSGHPIVVLFEDDGNLRKEYSANIKKALKGPVDVVGFYDQDTDESNLPAVAHVLRVLTESQDYNRGQIGLIVCDRDLTMYTQKGNPQSDRVVSEAAEKLGVPICLYEAHTPEGLLSLNVVGRWKQKEIVVPPPSDQNSARVCAGLYQGFEDIKAALKRIKDPDFFKLTPPDILARILHREDEVDRIALYGAGEQDALEELLPYHNEPASLKSRYHRVLGNWLYSSVLRFPGILVNEVAAASYLGINEKDFHKETIRKLFESAAYKGPFGDCGKRWWRRELDKMIADGGCETGFNYAMKKGKTVRPCKCSEENHPEAGYFCMIRERPVCEMHSRGGISWFPGGADLARVSLSEYKKIGPFLGLY